MWEETLAAHDESAAASSVVLARGVELGRYVLLDELARGGMGVVYTAYDPELDRKVALKLLRDAPGAKVEATTRLLREAQALAKLSHPNTIQIYDVGRVEDRIWLAMELVHGCTLAAWLKDRPRVWPDVLAVLRPVAEGLAAAHAAGLVHRDVKPDNVMIGDDHRVRVMDFGLARASVESPSTLGDGAPPESTTEARRMPLFEDVTRAGARPGTPPYMAPEQIKDNLTDARSDQFSFCVTSFEALFGQRPFVGDTLSELCAAISVGRVRPPPPESRVPGWLRSVVMRGLAVHPDERWPSMHALLEALEHGRARARRRRRVLAIAGVGLVAASIFTVDRWQRRQVIAACEEQGASIGEAWNDDRRELLRAAIANTGATNAEVTAQKVIPHVDAYAEAWTIATVGVCIDAHARGVLDAERLDRATWCLEARKAELAAFVEAQSEADASTVARAVDAVVRLTRVSPCTDPQVLARLPTPSPEQRAQAIEIRAEISRALALHRAGKYDAGLLVARAALAHAEVLDWPTLSAAARLRVGHVLESSGEFDEAKPMLEDAYFEAAEAGALELAAESANVLTFMLGYRLARAEDGFAWSRHVKVILATLPDPEGLRLAQYLNNLAMIHMARGEYEQSRRLHEQVLGIRERALGQQALDVALTLRNLAIAHAYAGDYDAAKVMHARALAMREELLGPEHPDVAASLNNLATIHQNTHEYDIAAQLLGRALAIRELTLGADHPDVATTLHNLAHVQGASGEIAGARATYLRAQQILERRLGPDNPDIAAIHNNLAELDANAGEYSDARAHYRESLAMFERALGPEHVMLAHPLVGLANVALAEGRFDEAVPLAERALTLREAGAVAPAEIAEARFALARALGNNGRDRARAIELAESARALEGAPREAIDRWLAEVRGG